jgi:hypothetical protein
MSVNSQKQTYKQFTEWLEWFNRKYNRLPKNSSRPKSYKKIKY